MTLYECKAVSDNSSNTTDIICSKVHRHVEIHTVIKVTAGKTPRHKCALTGALLSVT